MGNRSCRIPKSKRTNITTTRKSTRCTLTPKVRGRERKLSCCEFLFDFNVLETIFFSRKRQSCRRGSPRLHRREETREQCEHRSCKQILQKKTTGICSAKPADQVAPWKSKTRKVSLKKCLFKRLLLFPPRSSQGRVLRPRAEPDRPTHPGGVLPPPPGSQYNSNSKI